MARWTTTLRMTGLLAAWALPVWAEAPPCYWDGNARQFTQVSDLSATYVGTYGKAFVASAYDRGSDIEPAPPGSEMWGVLHHCGSDNHLSFRADGAGAPRTVQRFFALLDAPEPYTMTALADQMRAQGARVWLGEGGIGDCDCWFATANNMFE